MVGLGCMCIGHFALPNAPIATLILMSRTLSITDVWERAFLAEVDRVARLTGAEGFELDLLWRRHP